MSDMLNQAIIDATALKEAAVKSAEASLLEKYSSQIKEAVETILEQDEEMDMAPDADDAEMPEVPVASGEGTESCPCPDDDETSRIEIDLDDLMKQVDAGQPEAPAMDREATATELGAAAGALEESLEVSEELLKTLAGEEIEQIDESYDKEDFVDILEQLTVDLSIESHRPGHNLVSDEIVELATEELLALEQDSERKEKMEAMKKALEEAGALSESLKTNIQALQQEIKEREQEKQSYMNIMEETKNKLVNMNLTNARLFYTNKVLTNNSINERHKQRVVDALSESKTVEEAKIIFETLQSATGSTKEKPQSLSEAVNKTTSTLIMSRRNNQRQEIKKDPAINRWKTLAGINSINTKEES